MLKVGTKRRSLDDVVDELGFGWAQHCYLALGGGTGFLAGALKGLLGAVAISVGREWGLTSFERGALVSVVYIGQGVGNCVFGVFSDRVGRRWPLVGYYVVVSLCGLCSTLASSFWALLAWRGALGLLFGLGTSPCNALLGEVSPSPSRVLMVVLASLVFCLGLLYAYSLVWLEDPYMQHMDWRRLTICAALPGLAFFPIAYCLLPESPRFLDRAQRREEAVVVLRRMGALNGCPSVDVVDWHTSEVARDDGIATLWQRPLRFTTLALCLSTFVLNYSYYGASYVLPQLLAKKELYFSPAANMMVNLLVEPLGYFLALLLDRLSSRRASLLIYAGGLALFNAVFYTAAGLMPRSGDVVEAHHSWPILIGSAAMYGSQLSLAIGWIVVYVYAAEVYPTLCRASASGVCIAAGRLGSALCPIAFEAMRSAAGASSHFALVTVLAILNAVLFASLPLETKGRQLGEIAAESVPALAT